MDFSLNELMVQIDNVPIPEPVEHAEEKALLRAIDSEVGLLAKDLGVEHAEGYDYLDVPALRSDVVFQASELAMALGLKTDPECEANRRSWTGSPLKGGKPKSAKQTSAVPRQR